MLCHKKRLIVIVCSLIIFLSTIIIISKIQGSSDKSITINFHANGGSGTMEAMVIQTNKPITLPKNIFKKDNLLFAGWNTAHDGSQAHYRDEGIYSITEDALKLYAQWAAPEYTFENYDELQVFYIMSPKDLVDIAKLVRGGAYSFAGKKILLANDIDMKDVEDFKGLSRPYTRKDEYFQGNFDGDNRTIYNMKIVGETIDSDYTSFIGYIDNEGILQNIRFMNSEILGNTQYVGIVGKNYGTVKNIKNSGVAQTTHSYGYIGGLVAVNHGMVDNVAHYGSVTSNGGNVATGGVVGENNNTISHAVNFGQVIATGNFAHVGGIVGVNQAIFIDDFTISKEMSLDNVSNSATVTGTGESNIIGGVMGSNNGIVENIINTGLVTSSANQSQIGGIVGVIGTGKISNGYNIGKVHSYLKIPQIGGVVGSTVSFVPILYVKNVFFLQTDSINTHLKSIPQNVPDDKTTGGHPKDINGFNVETLGFPTDIWEDKTFTGLDIINGVKTRGVIKKLQINLINP